MLHAGADSLNFAMITFAASNNWFVCLNETENKGSDSKTKTGYIPLFSPGKNKEPWLPYIPSATKGNTPNTH